MFFKQSERTFLAESMYLCKWRFAATEYMDEQPDENFKQNVFNQKQWLCMLAE